MHKTSLCIWLFCLIWLTCCKSTTSETKETLYENKDYQLYPDKVVQGPYSAQALSATHVRSTYQSLANQSFSRLLEFKFSLNGKDNELPVGVNHRVILPATNEQVTLPVLSFGQVSGSGITNAPPDFLKPNTTVTFQVDLRPVLEAFKTKGFYEAFNGDKLYARDFKGVYIAGGSEPLGWDFENLPSRRHLQLTDPDQDGIYTVTLTFNAYNPDNFTASEWKLEKDISGLPQFQSNHVLVDALYNLSLEEMLKDIRPDSTFMAGEKWDGVWTRDISYSILLSLAAIEPQLCLNSLRMKVKDGRIIQDTGTGGSWPVSSDRMTWALAAWEVYKVTGDEEWLKEAYAIIKKSAEEDLATVVDHNTGLMRGESSFLDWRKQTYPAWMEPTDIYLSLTLGTNAVHYQTYRILEQMAHNLGQNSPVYRQTYTHIKKGINQHLWSPEKKYYGQYLYGRHHLGLSTKSEALGEALAVLFDIPDGDRKEQVLNNAPQTNYGTPSIYPYIPEIPPYHNTSMWPFVQAYWTWAAAKEGHTAKVTQGLGALYRAAGLFLTNKENLVATTGDFKGTEINSDRQLWSVAGNLAMVYRVFFGMEYTSKDLTFKPTIPPSFKGKKTLRNFKYRNAMLTVEVEGHGTRLKEILLDGKPVAEAIIPATLSGAHTLRLVMANDTGNDSPPLLVEHVFSPVAPSVALENGVLKWKAVNGVKQYQIYQNGQKLASSSSPEFKLPALGKTAVEYQVSTVDNKGQESFRSEPLLFHKAGADLIIDLAEATGEKAHGAEGFTGTGYLHLKKKGKPVSIPVNVPQNGFYMIDFRYANGNGPVNTDNKAAIRTLALGNQPVGAVVFPQRGFEEWSNWGSSNPWLVYLTKGDHTFSLRFEKYNENMNGDINEALVDHCRLLLVREK